MPLKKRSKCSEPQAVRGKSRISAWVSVGCWIAFGIFLLGGRDRLRSYILSNDALVTISPNDFLNVWLAAVGVWMLGWCPVLRYAWVAFRPARTPAVPIDPLHEMDDDRKVTDSRFAERLASLRTMTGGLAVFLLLSCSLNNLAGHPIGLLSNRFVIWAFLTMSLISFSCHWLLQWATRGFREKDYEPLEKTPRSIASLRRKYECVLEEAGFATNGVYRVRGDSFKTTAEFHMGCDGMVIGEFILQGGSKAIELASMTETGICIVTSSSGTPKGKPARRKSSFLYSHTTGISNLEKLLRRHLKNVAKVAERNDTMVVVLRQEDVVNVAKYKGRAIHQLRFERGESRDRIGPAQYGRFRFPTGLAYEARTTFEGDGSRFGDMDWADQREMDELLVPYG